MLTPQEVCCSSAADCDDGNPCTDDACLSQACYNTWTDAPGCCPDPDGCEPPVWDAVAPQVAFVGEELRFVVSASDPDTEDLDFLPGADMPDFVAVQNDAPQAATVVVTPAAR